MEKISPKAVICLDFICNLAMFKSLFDFLYVILNEIESFDYDRNFVIY